jgi:hypothetical protein
MTLALFASRPAARLRHRLRRVLSSPRTKALLGRMRWLPPGPVVRLLPWVFDPAAGGTSTGRLVIHVEGPGGGYWAVDVTSTGASVGRADAAAFATADCTLECDRDAWHRLVTGRITGMKGFMDGDVRLAGNFGLALRLDACFA